VATGSVYLKSDGNAWRPLVHVEDLACAYLASLHAPIDAIHDQAFNVGITSDNYRIWELAEIVQHTVPGSNVQFAENAFPDERNYRVNCDKIIHHLPEYKPRWTVERGVLELYNKICQAQLTTDDFEGPRYNRIAHIRELISIGQLDSDLRWRSLVVNS